MRPADLDLPAPPSWGPGAQAGSRPGLGSGGQARFGPATPLGPGPPARPGIYDVEVASQESTLPSLEGSLVIGDAATLRAIAHPARMRILEHLALEGPLTATACAGLTGLSPSACSYHLRLLGRAGLVAEAPSAGDLRQRPWRATFRGLTMRDSDLSADTPEFSSAAQAVVQQLLAGSERRMLDFLAREPSETPAWQAAAGLNQDLLDLTVDQARALRAELDQLVAPYSVRHRQPPIRPSDPESRLVHFEFRLIPLPESHPEPSERPAAAL